MDAKHPIFAKKKGDHKCQFRYLDHLNVKWPKTYEKMANYEDPVMQSMGPDPSFLFCCLLMPERKAPQKGKERGFQRNGLGYFCHLNVKWPQT